MLRMKKASISHSKISPASQSELSEDDKNIIQGIKDEMAEWNSYPEGLKRNYHLKHLLSESSNKKKILKYLEKNIKLRYNLLDIERLCGIRRN